MPTTLTPSRRLGVAVTDNFVQRLLAMRADAPDAPAGFFEAAEHAAETRYLQLDDAGCRYLARHLLSWAARWGLAALADPELTFKARGAIRVAWRLGDRLHAAGFTVEVGR